MDQRAKDLVSLGDKLFSTRAPLASLWEEIAENFYPERADFTSKHDWGEDFCDHLYDSYPVLARRELANTLSSMLRPKDRDWFIMTTLRDEIDEDPRIAKWLEDHTQVVRRAIYDRRTNFVRACKEGDHDYVTFGQCVIEVGENPERTHLHFRNWHLRDCAWMENALGEIDHLHRNMKISARNMKKLFGENKVHRTVVQACNGKESDKEFEVRHILIPSSDYDYKSKSGKKLPFVSIYVDKTNNHLISEGGEPRFKYVVPRWQTISGMQYAYSPATMITLPDARLAQEMARVLLEAGEKGVDPPLIATQEAVKGQVDIRAGGLTWVDSAYDEKLGEALRPLKIDGDFQTAFALRIDIREMLNKGMFLDKLALPDDQKEMTAFEVGRRLEEFIRNALPLFEPMETEYNGKVLDAALQILLETEAFDYESMPEELQGRDITFTFENPLQQAEGRAKVAQFQEALALIGSASQLGAQSPIDLDGALQDAIRGTGSPADWMLDDEQLKQNKEAVAEDAMATQMAEQVNTGAAVAGTAADSLLKLREAGIA
jgi:hypothetical protein